MDLVSGSYPGEIYWFRRKANGTFAAGETLKKLNGQALNVGRASCVAVTDWNGDGKLDLVVGDIDGKVHLVINKGTAQKPAFDKDEPVTADGKAIAGDLAGPCVADWDGDGKPDLIVGNGNGSVVFYRNLGTKTEPKLAAGVNLLEPIVQEGANQNSKRSGGRAKVSVTDWNGDGKPDLLVGDFNSDGSRQYHGWVWVYLRKSAESKDSK